jgi:hypothetical protein
MRGADHTENAAFSIVAEACLSRRCLVIEVLLLRTRVLRECVYQAVAQQRVYRLQYIRLLWHFNVSIVIPFNSHLYMKQNAGIHIIVLIYF